MRVPDSTLIGDDCCLLWDENCKVRTFAVGVFSPARAREKTEWGVAILVRFAFMDTDSPLRLQLCGGELKFGHG